MRVTDHRYTAEMARFQLAVRMISHEARTGTIRACTGFSEDRIRKIHGTYFKDGQGPEVRRRRGKSPSQIAPFINSPVRQSESTILACLFVNVGALQLDANGGEVSVARIDPVRMGNLVCDAYEAYRCMHPDPQLCFEKCWGLFKSMSREKELIFIFCANCGGPYVQDRYALDYQHCPLCDIRHGSPS